jgi:3-methyladenine DNA glycosylase AlkD/GNAT superfamily N-acetyltransferase
MWWRIPRSQWSRQLGESNRQALYRLVQEGQTPGLVAYSNGIAVGWVSLGPREEFSVLGRSRVLKPVDAQAVWSVVCFFLRKGWRRQGHTLALLQAAIEFARGQGASILEGYPMEPVKPSYPAAWVWTGFASTFRRAGFHEVSRNSPTRPIFRIELTAKGPLKGVTGNPQNQQSEKAEGLLRELQAVANPANLPGMARYGINTQSALGISLPFLRTLARRTGKDPEVATLLWQSGVHEARILAGLIADPSGFTEESMEQWVKDFDSWDLCDQVCTNLFAKTPAAAKKAAEWCRRPQEFVRRAGFVMIAALAVHSRQLSDQQFCDFFPLLLEGASDERNYVKKAVNWALRQMGKRNLILHDAAISLAGQIRLLPAKTARWIAADALRELSRDATIQRVREKEARKKHR